MSWLAEMIADTNKWFAYLVSFMFNHLPGSEKARIEQMIREVERFYSIFVTRAVRYPQRRCNFERLPRLFGSPEYGVPKMSNHLGLKAASINEGLHIQAVLLVPCDSRLQDPGPKGHIEENMGLYLGQHGKLREIYLSRITQTPEKAAEYNFKWEKRHPRFVDYSIILPRPIDKT